MKDNYLKEQRGEDLYRVYVDGLQSGRFVTMRDAADYARGQKAPRFYISAEKASLLVGRIIAKTSLITLNSLSRKRAWELYDRYEAFMRKNPDNGLCRVRIMELLVEEPAPEFYIGSEMARKILYGKVSEIRRKRANGRV